MRDELLLYYERELDFIRKLAADFAEKYPEVAGRLLLDPAKASADPHVERLIEAFSMLTARVHLRLDDDFPEVTDALLGILYPHYIAPIPSTTVVQLSLDPEQGKADEGVLVDRHSLMRAKPVNEVRCRFRTVYPVRLWPIEVSELDFIGANTIDARLPDGARSALRIRIRPTVEAPISEFSIPALTFYLHAGSGIVHVLHELLLRDPLGLVVRKGSEGQAVVLDPGHIRPVGYARDEGMLEYPKESFFGYRLLQEYFAFPDKYLFAELGGLDRVKGGEDAEYLEISVLFSESLNDIEIRLGPENLKLGCTPAVNLFSHTVDPIRLTHTSVDYPVSPDVRSPRSYEVYSVTSVSSTTPGTSEVKRFEPFYAIRHGSAQADDVAFWHTSRRPAMRKDDSGTDVDIRLVDRSFSPLAPAADVLHVNALCTNRDLPSRLQFGDPQGDLQLEGRPEITKVTCLTKPTPTLRPPIGSGSRWRLVSHLTLNYLSLSDGNGDGSGESQSLDSLREILKLYEFADTAVTRQRIEGLVGLRSKKVLRRVRQGGATGFARGIEVELEFDEEKYTGGGVFLFASVLERFLGLYTSLNSFTQTVARVRQRGGVLKKWPPRAGEIQIL